MPAAGAGTGLVVTTAARPAPRVMTMPSPRILVADDQADILVALRLLLSEADFDPTVVNSADAVVEHLGRDRYDLLLMDLNYTRDTTSGREGLELIDRVRAADAMLPIVVMTGWGSIETAVEAMRRGARSFVQKPWDNTTLVDVVRREVDEGVLTRRRDAQLAREHEEARLIQRALLPASMPSFRGCDVAATWTPASGLGGDCYDVLRFSDDRVALSIADVVGKGLPAALLMSNLQAAVRAFATPTTDPHDVCTSVNRLLCRNIAAGKFVTFAYAVIDLAAGQIRYANAGHNPPIIARAGGAIDRLAPTGLVLGVAPDWTYTTGELRFGQGDRLVFFTDGITEASSPDEEEFGDDRLIQTIQTAAPGPAAALAQTINAAVGAWTRHEPQDDATLIIVSAL
jgi:sigma-B regulation protein RsbU (phosphoserine phosphatase)